MKQSPGAAGSAFCLGLLTLAVAYAVVTHGGDAPFDSSVSLLLVGLAAVAASFFSFSSSSASTGDRVLGLAALLFPAYVLLQLVPLPLAVLRVVSPTRAEIADALGGVMSAPHFAPLSIAPPTTWVYLARIAGCALIFLLVRQIARQSREVPWGACVPLIVIACAEAVWALPENLGSPQPLVGTYFNKNHFAGLLEMVLPFCVMYAVVVLNRGRQRGGMTASDAMQACGLFASATAILVAIIFSLSKGGFLSTVASLATMSLLGFAARLSGWRRWSSVGGLVVLVATTFIFLTPTTLVEQFGGLASTDPTEGRWPIWKDAVRLFAAFPVFGCGLGNFFPGLMRYQTYGLNLAWTAAHNDYVQLLSELGLIGFLIPAVLMGGVFARAARTALSGATREGRCFGLACVGALTAILIHSVLRVQYLHFCECDGAGVDRRALCRRSTFNR